MEVIKIKCDDNLRSLLPILKNNIDDLSESDDSSSEYSSSNSEESFDTEIYNFDKKLDHNDIVFLLNTIGQTYLASKGFSDTQSIKFNHTFNDDLVKSLIEESKEGDYFINQSDENLNIGLEFYMQKSLTTIPYDKVIIKYNKHFNIVCEHNVKWITIDDKNHQLIISRYNKKLTLFDILYASRIIAGTYGMSNFVVQIGFQEFKVINHEEVLTLKY
jgi:hypothetical protein